MLSASTAFSIRPAPPIAPSVDAFLLAFDTFEAGEREVLARSMLTYLVEEFCDKLDEEGYGCIHGLFAALHQLSLADLVLSELDIDRADILRSIRHIRGLWIVREDADRRVLAHAKALSDKEFESFIDGLDLAAVADAAFANVAFAVAPEPARVLN